VLTAVFGEVDNYEERKKRNDRYDKECQMKVEEINKARNKMLNRRTRMNPENCRNRRIEAKKICRAKKSGGGFTHGFKVLAGIEEANKRNEARKFHTISPG
jgi:hypothetical protein